MRVDYQYSGRRGWFTTNHSSGNVGGGEDNQWVLFRTLYHPGRAYGLPAIVDGPHQMRPCDNNKGGRVACNLDEITMYHKIPQWEATRMNMLYRSALAGSCHNNLALLKWGRGNMQTAQ